jgi:hypothetical protein
MVQKITKLFTNTHNVVAEVNHEPQSRTNKFYNKIYFRNINSQNRLILEHQKLHENSFHTKSIYLTTMSPICPIYLIHPVNLQNSLSFQDLVEHILKGSNYILKGQRKTLFSHLDKNQMQQISEKVCGEILQSYNKNIAELTLKYSFKEYLLMNLKNLNMLCHYVTDKVDDVYETDNIYKIISFIFFGHPQFYMDIRILIYFVLQCISYMNPKSDFVKNNIADKSVTSF